MSAYDDLVLSRSPDLYWPLSTAALGETITAVTDLSGNGRNATPAIPGTAASPLVRGTVSSYSTGGTGRAIRRSGAGLGTGPAGRTIEVWVEFDSAALAAIAAGSQYPFIIGVGDEGHENAFSVYYDAGSSRFVLRRDHYSAGTDTVMITFSQHPVGQRFHIVGVQDVNGGVRCYVNNNLSASTTAPWSAYTPTTFLDVGGIGSNAARGFGGKISNVAIYGRPLTSAEISEHFEAGCSNYDATVLADDPYLYWRLDDAAVNVQMTRASDASGNYRSSATPTYQTYGAAPIVLGATGSANIRANYGTIISPSGQYPGTVASPAGMTYECWVSFTQQTIGNSGSYPIFMSRGPENTNGGQYLFYSIPDKRFAFRCGDWSGNRDANGPTLSQHPAVGVPIHLMGVLETDGTVRIFINGEEGPIVRPGPWSAYDGSGIDFRVGNNANATTFFYHGLISHAAVYTRPLTIADARNHYAAGARVVAGNAMVGGEPYANIAVYDAATMLLVATVAPGIDGSYIASVGSAATVYVLATKPGARPEAHGPVTVTA